MQSLIAALDAHSTMEDEDPEVRVEGGTWRAVRDLAEPIENLLNQILELCKVEAQDLPMDEMLSSQYIKGRSALAHTILRMAAEADAAVN